MSTAKAEVLELLGDLPDDCTAEDILYHLSVWNQIRQGLWSLENEPVHTHEEVERSVSRWLVGARDGHHSSADPELRSALDAMVTCSAKAEVLAALDELPDDCSLHDVAEQLHEREQIRQGLASALNEPRVSQDQVEAWIDRWERE